MWKFVNLKYGFLKSRNRLSRNFFLENGNLENGHLEFNLERTLPPGPPSSFGVGVGYDYRECYYPVFEIKFESISSI